MKKNRKRPKRLSVVAEHTMHVGVVMLMLFVMVIVNLMAKSNCKQLNDAIHKKSIQLEKLENERQREVARWEEMKTPERLEMALKRMGLAMHLPHPDQVIYMTSDGRPKPAQIAIAKAQRRLQEKATATASYSARPARGRRR